MKYKIHKLNINLAKEYDTLETFLNNLKGEVEDVRTLALKKFRKSKKKLKKA